MQSTSMRNAALFTLLLVTTYGAISCARVSNGDQAQQETSSSAASVIVPVAKVQRSTLSQDLTLSGEFVPYQEIDVMAKEAGYIRAIHVDIGDKVQAGHLLAELEIPEMGDDRARAAAGVQAAQADIATRQGEVDRAQAADEIATLSYRRIADVARQEPGLVPQQEIDVARSKQLEASAQVSTAKSSLQAAERKVAMAKADQSRWNTLERYTIITAPFTAVVTRRYANTGAMIQQGTASNTQALPIVRLSQNNLLRLMLPVPESAVPVVQIGAPVEVSVDSLDKTFPGKITRFEDKISSGTRTMNTEVDVPNPKYTLVPGMYAQVTLHLQHRDRTLVVPVDAVEESGGTSHVYAVNGSTVHVVAVKAGLRTASQQEIRGGLAEGDLVVVGRHAGLTEGESVQPKLVHFDSSPEQGS